MESNYSKSEHEMLGVAFSMIHFKHFTYGRQVHIITDHKPLITLFAKNLATTFPRLSQMLIKILDYVVVLHHQEGNKKHLSDAISRLSVHDSDAAKSKAKPMLTLISLSMKFQRSLDSSHSHYKTLKKKPSKIVS